MADILPFRGVRYNIPAIDGKLDSVVAPPYDVISKSEQNNLYDLHPNNVVRLILGREENRYASAAVTFKEWVEKQILTYEDQPALYVYHQTFDDPVTGKPAPERTGIICLLKLEDYSTGKVLPHENTLTAAKSDRLELMRATNAQFESIYGLYSDPDRSVESFLQEYDDQEPILEKVDNVIGSSHRVERIVDADAIAIIQELLRDKSIFIADGHHRYETALNYRNEKRAALGIDENTRIPEDYILITLTAFEDEGLLVLPTHRLVHGIDQSTIDRLPQLLSDQFNVEKVAKDTVETRIDDAAHKGFKAFGVVLPNGQTYIATLKTPISEVPALIDGELSDASKRLDVTILQYLILQKHLGVTAEKLAAGVLGYTRDTNEAFDEVENGRYQIAFILGRPSVEDVRLVSLAGDKMPQKSTFFYPKLLSGLVLRDLKNDN